MGRYKYPTENSSLMDGWRTFFSYLEKLKSQILRVANKYRNGRVHVFSVVTRVAVTRVEFRAWQPYWEERSREFGRKGKLCFVVLLIVVTNRRVR